MQITSLPPSYNGAEEEQKNFVFLYVNKALKDVKTVDSNDLMGLLLSAKILYLTIKASPKSSKLLKELKGRDVDNFWKDWVTINGNHIFIDDSGNQQGQGHSEDAHEGGVATDNQQGAYGVQATPTKDGGEFIVGGRAYQMNAQEYALVKSKGLEITVNNRGKFSGRYTPGTSGNYQTIELNAKNIAAMNQDDGDSTFYHELGHFIDSNQGDGNGISYSYDMLNADNDFRGIMNSPEETQIVAGRLSGGPLGNTFSSDELVSLASGNAVNTVINGTTRAYSIPNSYMNYVSTPREVFADAYAQYRTQPAQLQTVAPTAYNYMSNVFNKH